MKSDKIILILLISVLLGSCASSQSKMAQKNEKDPQHQYELARMSMRYNLTDEAIKYLNNALSLDPNHQPSYYLLGMAYVQKKNLKEAAAAFQKSLELKPDFSEAHVRLGAVYQEMGLPDKAEEEYKKSYAIDENAVASFNLALLYYEDNKLEQALEYVQKSIQKENRSAESYNLQGVILNRLSRYPESIDSFQNALKIDQNHVIANINLAVAYINNNDFNRAREILEKVLPLVQEKKLKDKINEYLEKIKELKKRMDEEDIPIRNISLFFI